MNKKRTRTFQYHDTVYFRSGIIRSEEQPRQYADDIPFVSIDRQSYSMMDEDYPHLIHLKMNHCKQHHYRRAFQSYFCCTNKIEWCFRYINNIFLLLTRRHDVLRRDRHDNMPEIYLRNLILLLVLSSLLYSSTTSKSMVLAWMTLPTTSFNAYKMSHNSIRFELHTRLHYPPSCLLNIEAIKRLRCLDLLQRRYNTAFYSSSNSITSSDVGLLDNYDRNDNNEIYRVTEDSNNSMMESATNNNAYLSEPIYCNITNDDNPSLQHDSDSFWVTPTDYEGNVNINNDSYDDDVPRPTENGGYSHTQASRAKISAANKGKVPWNKGVNRTDEVKARIAAGVRAKNRERHLQKLQEIGITEEEYEEQKRMERSAKEAERRARRTENGGYRPTEETKRKISEILKQKFATGEIKPRPISPIHVRRGFTHSEETRQKISESLRKRWSTDPEYRAKMVDVSNRVNTKDEVRQKISESLRNKWQSDDSFRNDMMSKIAARKRRVLNPITGAHDIVHHDEDHRAKISAAMKAKWQEKEYREKNLSSLASRRTAPIASDHTNTAKSSTRPPIVPRTPKQKPKKSEVDALSRQSSDTLKQKVQPSNSVLPISSDIKEMPLKPMIPKSRAAKVGKENTVEEAVLLRPVQPLTAPHKKVKKAGVQVVTSEKTRPDDEALHRQTQSDAVIGSDKIESFADSLTPKKVDVKSDVSLDMSDVEFDLEPDIAPAKKEAKSASAATSNGNVALLKAERRDLYDLLYGDDDDNTNMDNSLEEEDISSSAHINDDYDESTLTGSTTPTLASIFARLEDDNLDTFDPYGLDDF